jgi:hypothetical protein
VNGRNLPVDYVKAVDHRDGSECGIEIKDCGAPLAVYYVLLDFDAGFACGMTSVLDDVIPTGAAFQAERGISRL